MTDLAEQRGQDPTRRLAKAVAYLRDSNLVIPYLADNPATVPLVERLAPKGIATSIITSMEVYPGTLRSPDPGGDSFAVGWRLPLPDALLWKVAKGVKAAKNAKAPRGRGDGSGGRANTEGQHGALSDVCQTALLVLGQ